MAAKQLDLPAVATLHLWTSTPFIVKVHEWLDALMLRFFDRVVAVSDEIGKEMADKGIPRRLIRIIRNGIEVETLSASENGARSEIRREFGIREDAPVVGIVGRLAPEKGHGFFLDAAREVLRVVPDATFVVVGGGLLEGELKARAERLGFADAVRFAGVRRDIARFYEAFDLLVSSSLREGTPMVLLEAMAMGKPVIATRVGGVPHLVRHDETGLVVPPGDVPALARAILELLQDRGRRAKLARAGQRLIRDEFSAMRMAEAYAKVYEEARALHRTVRRPWATRIVSEG
jgi:glycosyltransferase involved in cell wall biosynthesis